MGTDAPGESELLDLLYHAPTEATGWTQFLAALARRFHAPWSGLLETVTVSDETKGAARTSEFAHQFGIPPQAFQPYGADSAAQAPWFLASRERHLTEWVGRGSELCPPEWFERSEFCSEFFRAHRYCSFYQLGALTSPDRGRQAALTILREPQQNDFDESEVQDLRGLVPHLRRALQIHAKMTSLRLMADAKGAVLASLDVAVIALDLTGRVCFLNGAAESILRAGDVLRLRHGRLVAAVASESAALQKLVDATGREGGSNRPLGGHLTLHSRERSLYLTAFPLAAPVIEVPGQARVLVTVSLHAAPRPRHRSLATLFGLTPAEIRVTMLLVEGMEPKEIAERTGVTYETVRFQLKSIYNKMGVTRQSQVVRIVSLLPASP